MLIVFNEANRDTSLANRSSRRLLRLFPVFFPPKLDHRLANKFAAPVFASKVWVTQRGINAAA